MADKDKSDSKNEEKNKKESKEPLEQLEKNVEHPPTGYFESFIHLSKGTVGAGMFAMGEAIKNCGYLVGPPLIVFIGVTCIHCQHILVNCSIKVQEQSGILYDYADTIRYSFELGPEKYRKMSSGMALLINIFIFFTQFGFCAIYLVFIGNNLQQILDSFDIHFEVYYLILMVFVPVLLSCLITSLKLLTPVSLVADIFLAFGFLCCIGFAIVGEKQDLSNLNATNSLMNMSLFFGTVIFSYESIALILPIRNSMKNPHDFDRKLGVINVASFFITSFYILMGVLAYWRWGNDVQGSVTLNLGKHWLAQTAKVLVSVGILFGLPLQFFVLIQILWPGLQQRIKFCQQRPFTGILLFRAIMMIIILIVACAVPNLGLFISLVGALCSTTLALLIPPMVEMLLIDANMNKCLLACYAIKNILIICFALFGMVVGSYEALRQIIDHYTDFMTNNGAYFY